MENTPWEQPRVRSLPMTCKPRNPAPRGGKDLGSSSNAPWQITSPGRPLKPLRKLFHNLAS